MDFQTPRSLLTNPLLSYPVMEDDVSTAYFSAYEAQVRLAPSSSEHPLPNSLWRSNSVCITPSAWSQQSPLGSSYGLEESSNAGTDTGKESTPVTTPRPATTATSTRPDEGRPPPRRSKRAVRNKDRDDTTLLQSRPSATETGSLVQRRREQNRANQRAYRKRKEQHIKELKAQLDEMRQKNQALTFSCSLLSKECARLRSHLLSNPATAWASSAGSGAQDPGIVALAEAYANAEAAHSPSGPAGAH